MTSSRSRRNRNRRRTFNGSPADHDDTQWIGRLRTDDTDGATYEPGDQAAIDRIREAGLAAWDSHHHFGGVGLPGGIAYLAAIAVTGTGPDTQPLTGLRAEPRYAPAPAKAADEEPAPLALLRARTPAPDMLPALPAPPPASAEMPEPAVIGDALRLPVIWCEMPRCIGFHHDPASTGYADTRERAATAGWRTDTLGRLACPPCQQARADYRTPQPLAWHHKEVARRWNSGEPLDEETAFRLGVVAEYCRRISRENPAWALAMAGATARQRRTAGAS